MPRREFIGLDEIPDATHAVAEHAHAVVKARRERGLPTCGDDCGDLPKLAALMEEVGEVAEAIHDGAGLASLRGELLDVATAASLWAWAIEQELV